jgi:hypothetical protein
LKRLIMLAVVLGVMVSSVSAYTRPGMMPATNACPVCTIGNGSAESVISSPTDSEGDTSGAVTANDVVPDPSTDPGVDTSSKATPILF